MTVLASPPSPPPPLQAWRHVTADFTAMQTIQLQHSGLLL
jgi:hypothetical protein